MSSNASFSKINSSIKTISADLRLRDKVLAIQVMQLLGPNYNESFVDTVERVIQSLRESEEDMVFEVEDLLDFLLEDP
jgi:hypothetical protein